MHHILGIEAVVAELVEYQFVRGEIKASRREQLRECLGEKQERRLAEGIAVGAVTQMTHGAHRLNDRQLGEALTKTLDEWAPSLEERL